MGKAGDCRFPRESAGPVAMVIVLVVTLHASLLVEPVNAECSTIDPLSLNYTESNFAVQQTRLTPLNIFELEQCSWQVWGVATILLGGANSDSRVYWFDCYHNTLLEGLRWYRVDSNADPETSATPRGGVRFSLTSSNVANSLGLYACEATDGSVTLLNITDAVIGLNPVEGNVEAFAGDTVTLSTYISSTNGHLTLVRWKSPGGDTLREYPGPGQKAPTTPSRLVLSNVTTDDSGTYNVSVFSTDVGVTYNSHTLINLDVLVPSHITMPPLSVLTTDEWEDIEIECVASGSGPITVSWTRNNSLPLPPALRSNIQTSTVDNSEEGIVTVTSRLIISSILYSDRGGYRCSAYNSLTTINHTDTTDFIINVNPVIRIESEGLTNSIVVASLGTSLTIKCFGSGTLNWARTPASEEIFYTESHPTQNLLTLFIPNFVVPATYVCSSDISPELRKYVSISTHAHLSVFISTEGIFTFRDSSVSITAYIHSAEPVTSVLWYRNGTVLDLESDPHLTASFDSPEASLEIESFGDQDVGLYVVVVNNSEETANTSVQVMYPDLTTVRVSVSHQVVEVGERVEVNCTGLGSGPLTIVWTFENGIVITEGSQLVIAAASLFHSGLYTCTVSSPYYQDQTTFDLNVLERLVALVEYNDVINSSHAVSLRHGDGTPPTFGCIANGSSSSTTIAWQLSGRGSLPSGVSVDMATHHLTWTHRLDYSDSGVYQCIVRDTVRMSVASVDLTVTHEPVLDTIYPGPGITKQPSATYTVPLGYTGTALTCLAFAWPTPPDVSWTRNAESLPRGMGIRTTTEGGIVISELIVSSQFSVVNVGVYRCEVRRPGEEATLDVELVELAQSDSATSQPEEDCERVSGQDKVLFQVRVVTSDCLTWNQDTKSAITEEFQNLLFRIISTGCGSDCGNFSKTTITVIDLDCSIAIDGGTIFRGSIATGSAQQTEAVTCELSRWQKAGPLVSVEGKRFLVDSQCPLKIDSYSVEECVVEEESEVMQLSMVLTIAVPVGVVGILLSAIVFIIVLSFCCQRCRGGSRKISDHENEGPYEINTLSYARRPEPMTETTDLGSNRLSVSNMSRQQDNPHYAQLDERYYPLPRQQQPESPVYDVALSPDRRPLFYGQPESLPRELNDSGVSLSAAPGSGSPSNDRQRSKVSPPAQPYQIPTASTGSLNKVGVANPMWGPEHHHQPPQRNERRFSEGPLTHSNPSPLGAARFSSASVQDRDLARPIGHTTRDQSTGLSSSIEDYSHLDFSLPKSSTSHLSEPQRKWYMTSEGSYAPLGVSESAIRPYDAVLRTSNNISQHHHVTRATPTSSPLGKVPPTGSSPLNKAPPTNSLLSPLNKAPPISPSSPLSKAPPTNSSPLNKAPPTTSSQGIMIRSYSGSKPHTHSSAAITVPSSSFLHMKQHIITNESMV